MRFLKTYSDDPIQPPKNDIVGIEPRFVFRNPLTLILREKIFSFSGDDFSIKDINNVEYFRCKGKALSIRDKKILYDLYQKPILNIQHKILTLKGNIKIYAEDKQDKILATINKKSFISVKKYIIEFYNQATEKTEYLDMKCDFFSYSCGIYYGHEKEGAPLICKITKKIDMKLVFTTQENYFVQIAPGVDAALMMAIAICFDEYKNEDDSY
ncbi:hypothetical protein PIROE2DRAFT_44426 [Piromyces sp. E2]|nr:hypothetical protein PIROE2DRAFT_44426 [Piromyces sp. E2]|eukprot:OUM62308.1 hypothetical protein PIROE2DRAFT_44426 [Piromyces sp. E2]